MSMMRSTGEAFNAVRIFPRQIARQAFLLTVPCSIPPLTVVEICNDRSPGRSAMRKAIVILHGKQ
ncbi:MAG TPA: hypothetical protein VES70_02380, partial [Pseudomonas sp.]|nr:hypothetical protein [Pseudomonas sp.]